MRANVKLTSNHWVTIPAAIRDALGLRAGDRVEFLVRGKSVIVRRARIRLDDALAFRLARSHTMRDWDTPEDDAAFRCLGSA